MVKLRSVQWHDEAWEVRFDIEEGVYRLENYPVRITHLGRTEALGLEDDLARAAQELLRRHMRRGAVPPHAVVVNWSRVDRLSQGGSQELLDAIARISSKGETLGEAVSEQF